MARYSSGEISIWMSRKRVRPKRPASAVFSRVPSPLSARTDLTDGPPRRIKEPINAVAVVRTCRRMVSPSRGEIEGPAVEIIG
jgi:hypothetical protein